MKVLFITHDNGVGGIWKVTENLAKGFMARGIDTRILIISVKFTEPNPNVMSCGVPFNFYHATLKNPLKGIFLQAIPAIRRTYRKFAPDRVVSSYYYLNFLAVLALWNKNIIVCEHGSFKNFARSRNVRGFKGWIADIANFIVVQFDRFAGKIVVVSDGLRDELVSYFKLPAHKIIRIYNPVVTEELLTAAMAPVDHPWIQYKSSKIILSVGRLIAHKDYPTLIHAFKKVRLRIDCKLIMVSDGPERQHLQNLVKSLGLEDSCMLTGFVENQYAYMSKTDVFVLPSTLEGFALVIAEALACGCQVVSTDCPSGPAEILEGGKYGALVPMRDIDAMANAIYDVLAGHNTIPHEQLTARANDFSADKAIAEYCRILAIP